MTANPVALLTVGDVAAALKVSPRSVYGLMYDGKIASVHVGRCRRITSEALARYIETLTVQSDRADAHA